MHPAELLARYDAHGHSEQKGLFCARTGVGVTPFLFLSTAAAQAAGFRAEVSSIPVVGGMLDPLLERSRGAARGYFQDAANASQDAAKAFREDGGNRTAFVYDRFSDLFGHLANSIKKPVA
jgi:hypothetical protein